MFILEVSKSLKMKHFTQTQRYEIYRMRQSGHTQSEIAFVMGCSQAAISKELKKGKTKRGTYSPKLAQEQTDERKNRFFYPRKFNREMERFVREKIEKHQWSPEQIVGYCKKNAIPIVSIERIYQFIRSDKHNGGKLYKHCRHRLKHRKRYVGAGVAHIPNRVSIKDRPLNIDQRKEFGHYEMDLIQGTGKSYILSLIERNTRYLILKKLDNGKMADDVENAVFAALIPYKKQTLSITTDNGGEFANHLNLCKKLKLTVYFTDPYSAWQKGSIENANKLVRQYLPKGTNFDDIDYQEINNIQKIINSRPRKILNFECPKNIFFYNFAA
jgi:IS30 family transposase